MSNHAYHKIKIGTAATWAVLLLLLGVSLTACGKRPGFVDPPPNIEDDTFPRTYPDPATDPKP